jgi:hypothetical protein
MPPDGAQSKAFARGAVVFLHLAEVSRALPMIAALPI